MTSHLLSHTTTNAKPKMLSVVQVQTGNEFHMIYIMYQALPIFMQRQQVQSYTYGLNQHYTAFFSAECLKISCKDCRVSHLL